MVSDPINTPLILIPLIEYFNIGRKVTVRKKRDVIRRSASKKVLYLIHEALGPGVVLIAIGQVDFLQLAQQFLLTIRQPYRGFNNHMAHQVAR